MRVIGAFLVVFTVIANAPRAYAVVPGGVYAAENTMTLKIEDRQWPSTLGYHVLRGTTVYHGRRMLFVSGIFLPPAFFHTTQPMPVLMALHNRFAIGFNGGAGLGTEGMGRVLARGGEDSRAVGERAVNPISLREDAQFIGLVPQCPAGFGWESPPLAKLMCTFIGQVVGHYHADDDRVYLTGFSYGASSTCALRCLRRIGSRPSSAAMVCATPDPIHDVAKLNNVAIYLEVGQWDGVFVEETDRMHQALNTLPHRNYIFRMIDNGNHFCYQTVYDDPNVWRWVLLQRRKPAAQPEQASTSHE